MHKHPPPLKSSKYQSDKTRIAAADLSGFLAHLYKHVNVRMCDRVLGCLYVSAV